MWKQVNSYDLLQKNSLSSQTILEGFNNNLRNFIYKGCEEKDSSSGIFESKNENKSYTNKKISTPGRTDEESSSHKEDEVYFKVSR